MRKLFGTTTVDINGVRTIAGGGTGKSTALVASDISDTTATGRSMMTAASVAAERAILATGNDATLASYGITGGGIIPTGSVVFADYLSSGMLRCDNSAVSRTTYAGLYGVLGAKYGAGNGSTTFNLPYAQHLQQINVPATALSTAVYYQTVTQLGDGRILVIGGEDATATAIANTYFGTITGNGITWAAGTSLPASRYGHTTTLLADGRILVTGGYDTAARTTTYFGTISGNTITWVAGTVLGQARYLHTTSLLSDGRIFVAGGWTASAQSATVFGTISGNTITWAAGTNIPAVRYGHAAVVLDDGRVVISGGRTTANVNSAVNTMYFGTIATNTVTWVTGTPMPETVYGHAIILLDDHRFFLVGGYSSPKIANVATTYFGTLATTTITWVAGLPIPTAIQGHGLLQLADGRPIMVGGFSTTALADIYFLVLGMLAFIKT